MSKTDAAIDTLHAHRVLLILIELAKDCHELGLTDFGYQLDHVIQNDGCLFSNLRNLVHGSRIIHVHYLLLIWHSKARIDLREERNSGHLTR